MNFKWSMVDGMGDVLPMIRGPPEVQNVSTKMPTIMCSTMAMELVSCLPEAMLDKGEAVTRAEIADFCSCKPKFDELVAHCPEMMFNELGAMMVGICSSCGSAIATYVYNRECMKFEKEEPAGPVEDQEVQCGTVCRPLMCDIIAQCPEGSKFGDGSPKEMLDDIGRLTQKCPCSA